MCTYVHIFIMKKTNPGRWKECHEQLCLTAHGLTSLCLSNPDNTQMIEEATEEMASASSSI